MLESHLRPSYQRFCVNPIAHYLHHKHKVNPCTLTWIAGLIGSLTACAIAWEQTLLAIIGLLLSGYLDTLDGTLARLSQTTNDWGCALDILTDRFVEVAIVIGLFFVDPSSRAIVSMAMLSAIILCVTSFLVVGLLSQNNSQKRFYYSEGLMERAEAFIFFGLMVLFPHTFIWLGSFFTGLVLFTALQRMHAFKRQLECGE